MKVILQNDRNKLLQNSSSKKNRSLLCTLKWLICLTGHSMIHPEAQGFSVLYMIQEVFNETWLQ